MNDVFDDFTGNRNHGNISSYATDFAQVNTLLFIQYIFINHVFVVEPRIFTFVNNVFSFIDNSS